jgi:hypothetical protein
MEEKTHVKKKLWAIGGATVLAALMIACGGNPSTPATTPPTMPTTPATTKAATAKPVPTAPASSEAIPLTAEQKNAVSAAEGYLEYQGFSRAGLIEQLSSDFGDGYTKADATKAVDSLHVDWNAQAVRVAKSYLSIQHFSRKGLQEQLESSYGEKFTHAQAAYGVAHSGL